VLHLRGVVFVANRRARVEAGRDVSETPGIRQKEVAGQEAAARGLGEGMTWAGGADENEDRHR